MVVMVSSQDWPQPLEPATQNFLCALSPVLLQRHILPFLEPADLMAMYHTCRHLQRLVAVWSGWSRLYKQNFNQDWVASPESASPFEAYLLRSKAQVYVLWLVPNKKPQIVGPTPAFSVRKIASSRIFATILSTNGQLYAIEEKTTQPEAVGVRWHRMLRPGDCKLGLSRMRHRNTRFNPKFIDVWGSHAFTHALTDRNELYLWYSSEMRGFKLLFPFELGKVHKVASCSSNSWHVAHVDRGILWWSCDYTAHTDEIFAVKKWEFYADNVADMVVIGTRLLVLLDDTNTVLDLALGTEGVAPSQATYNTWVAPDGCVRLGSCLSILSLFCRDGSAMVVDINYPENILMQDASDAVDIFVQPSSTWKLRKSGQMFHRSAYNWANSLLWTPAEITPLSVASPNSLVLDSLFKWTPAPSSTRQPIVLDPNAVENLSFNEATDSIFMHRVLQVTHQFTPHSLNSLHLVLMESSLGDIFSGSTLHATPRTKAKAKVDLVESESGGWWRRIWRRLRV